MAQIQVPADGELLRDDFVLSGMVFDDDGVQAVWYRIDNGEFQRLAGGNNFSVPLSIAEVSDNEHVVEVKAEDLGGVMSAVAKARFKVSRSDPVSSLVSPRISDHLRDIVDLKGTSRDPNGIAEVRISFDNGLSFNRVKGTETWQYRLDTRLLADGTQAVLVRAVDADRRGRPVHDDDQHRQPRARAGGRLARRRRGVRRPAAPGRQHPGHHRRVLARGQHHAHGGNGRRREARCGRRSPGPASSRRTWTSRASPPGWYNVQIEAADRAGNKSYVSRNFVKRPAEAERVEILYPAAGERLAGPFTVSGRVLTQSHRPTGRTWWSWPGGQPIDTTLLDAQGYFNLVVKPAGPHAPATSS